MKHLLSICVCLLFCVSSWAGRISIDLTYDYAAERSQDERSVSVFPTAAYEGNTVYIHSYIYIEKMEVVVKDGSNNVVYSGVLRVPAGQSSSFTLNAIAGEEYVIELTYGDKFLSGSFEL